MLYFEHMDATQHMTQCRGHSHSKQCTRGTSVCEHYLLWTGQTHQQSKCDVYAIFSFNQFCKYSSKYWNICRETTVTLSTASFGAYHEDNWIDNRVKRHEHYGDQHHQENGILGLEHWHEVNSISWNPAHNVGEYYTEELKYQPKIINFSSSQFCHIALWFSQLFYQQWICDTHEYNGSYLVCCNSKCCHIYGNIISC